MRTPQISRRRRTANDASRRPCETVQPRREFHRYCSCCGWGFTTKAWKAARYCPRCGVGVRPEEAALRGGPASSLPLVPDRASNRYVSSNVQACRRGDPRRIRPLVPSAGRTGFFDWLDSVCAWGRRHPVAAGGLLAASGAGLILTGPVLATAGAALSAMGASLAAGTTVSGLVVVAIGVFARQFPVFLGGLAVAGVGTMIGAAISLIGAIVAAAGAFFGGIGWVALAACLLLVLKRGGEAAWENRKRIAAWLGQVRESLRTGISADNPAPERIALPSEPSRSFTMDDLFAAVEAECEKLASAAPAQTP